MNKTTTIYLTLLTLLMSGSVLAKGGLDKTFGGTGKVSRDFNGGFDFGMAMALQADGKILLTGYARFNGKTDFILMRYLTNGSMDLSFGDSGLVITDFGKNESAFGVVVQPDGKIVVAGQTDAGTNSDFALARYKSNGHLDSSFGVNGKVIAEIGIYDDFGQAVTLQPDGKIIVAGYSGANPKYDVSVARFLPNGTIDSSFSGDGRVITSVSAFVDFGSAVQVQKDGKIVVAGRALIANYDMAIVRYHADGSLDLNFGNSGIVIATPGTMDDMAYALAIQEDQKIVIAGTSNTGAYGDMAVLRFDTSGQADLGFGSGGKRLLAAGNQNDVAYAVYIQSDGKILLGGYGKVGEEFYFALARVDAAGLQDNTFGEKGVQAFSMGTDAFMFSMAVQDDHKIIVAGVLAKDTDYDVLIGRFDPELMPSTGIEENNGPGKISIYPHPVKDGIHISSVTDQGVYIQVDLLDMQGKHVASLYNRTAEQDSHQDLYLELPSGIAAGVYMLHIQSAVGSVIKKLIVADR